MINQNLNKLHNNPVKAGFVNNPEDWKYSSTLDYSGLKGYVDMKILK